MGTPHNEEIKQFESLMEIGKSNCSVLFLIFSLLFLILLFDLLKMTSFVLFGLVFCVFAVDEPLKKTFQVSFCLNPL